MAPTTLNDLQNDLARAAQKGFPLLPDPFSALGQPLGLSGAEVLAQLQGWTEEGKLREVSAVLEGSALDYDSALVTARVAEADLDRVGAVVSAHPTVTHNYLRDHHYNLWFTIAVPRAEMPLERTLELLAAEAGVERFLPLRRTTTFKIGVNFDLKKQTSLTDRTEITEVAELTVGDREKRLFRAMQTPLPLVENPYGPLAEQAGVTVDELLEFAWRHHGGAIRRYVATFRHRKLGVRGNGMGVWRVPEGADLQALGLQLAHAPEVSHCYARNPIEGFPYTLYSMIHGPDRETVEGVGARLAQETGLDDYLLLFSTKELKKCRLRYFLPELDRWWKERTA